MNDSIQAAEFLRQIEERLRELTGGSGLVAGGCPDASDDEILSTLEMSFEELQVTVEELHAKEEALAEAAVQLEEERSRYHRLFQLAPSPSVITDAGGMIEEVNEAALGFLPLAGGKLQRMPLASLFSDDDRRKLRARLGRALRLETVSPFRVEVVPPEDEPVPTLVSVSPLPRADGTGTELLWSFTPLGAAGREEAERLARERAERENEEEARFLFRSGARLLALGTAEDVAAAAAELAVPFLGEIAVVDLLEADGSLVRVGVAHADPGVGEDVVEILHRAPDPGAEGGVGEAIERGSVRIVSATEPGSFAGTVLGLEEGEETPPPLRAASFVIAPLSVEGRTLGALTLASADPPRDYGSEHLLVRTYARCAALVLDRARGLQKARRAESQAESTRRAAHLLSSISHEFRTPLHSILGYCELLLDGLGGELSGPMRRYVEGIRASAQHQVGLVDNLVTLGKSQIGQSDLRIRDVDVSELAEEVVSVTRPLVRDEPLELSARLPEEGLHLRTDPRKLRQVLINLLSNAVKYTAAGSVELEVRQEGDGTVAFVVRDTGPGIAAEDVEWLFEPFWRGDDRRPGSEKHGGSGLGLSVVRTLAGELGGEVSVDTVLDEGSTFTLRLPREIEEAAP